MNRFFFILKLKISAKYCGPKTKLKKIFAELRFDCGLVLKRSLAWAQSSKVNSESCFEILLFLKLTSLASRIRIYQCPDLQTSRLSTRQRLHELDYLVWLNKSQVHFQRSRSVHESRKSKKVIRRIVDKRCKPYHFVLTPKIWWLRKIWIILIHNKTWRFKNYVFVEKIFKNSKKNEWFFCRIVEGGLKIVLVSFLP